MRRFLTSYELLVAHNAAFDFRFINPEMASAGLSTLTRPIYCTMKGYRALGRGGSAALSAVCSHIKLARSGQLHAAIEDAWLAMQIYLWLHGCPFQRSRVRCLELRPTFVTSRSAGSVPLLLITTAGAPVSRSSDLGQPMKLHKPPKLTPLAPHQSRAPAPRRTIFIE